MHCIVTIVSPYVSYSNFLIYFFSIVDMRGVQRSNLFRSHLAHNNLDNMTRELNVIHQEV